MKRRTNRWRYNENDEQEFLSKSDTRIASLKNRFKDREQDGGKGKTFLQVDESQKKDVKLEQERVRNFMDFHDEFIGGGDDEGYRGGNRARLGAVQLKQAQSSGDRLSTSQRSDSGPGEVDPEFYPRRPTSIDGDQDFFNPVRVDGQLTSGAASRRASIFPWCVQESCVSSFFTSGMQKLERGLEKILVTS